MNFIFGSILVLALIATIVIFTLKGLARLKRESVLMQKAIAAGLVFSREDTFDILGQFSDFSLMDCGHNRRAYNVAQGRIEGCDVRAFDFRYEIGHGSRRATKNHGVIMVQVPLQDWTCLWSGQDVEHYPLIVDNIAGSLGRWSYAGCKKSAQKLCRLADEFASGRVSIELHRGWLMFSFGVNDENWWDYSRWLEHTVTLANRLDENG